MVGGVGSGVDLDLNPSSATSGWGTETNCSPSLRLCFPLCVTSSRGGRGGGPRASLCNANAPALVEAPSSSAAPSRWLPSEAPHLETHSRRGSPARQVQGCARVRVCRERPAL